MIAVIVYIIYYYLDTRNYLSCIFFFIKIPRIVLRFQKYNFLEFPPTLDNDPFVVESSIVFDRYI